MYKKTNLVLLYWPFVSPKSRIYKKKIGEFSLQKKFETYTLSPPICNLVIHSLCKHTHVFECRQRYLRGAARRVCCELQRVQESASSGTMTDRDLLSARAKLCGSACCWQCAVRCGATTLLRKEKESLLIFYYTILYLCARCTTVCVCVWRAKANSLVPTTRLFRFTFGICRCRWLFRYFHLRLAIMRAATPLTMRSSLMRAAAGGISTTLMKYLLLFIFFFQV